MTSSDQDIEKRALEVLEVVMSIANLDYSARADISDDSDTMDALATGINMLGEELKATTVSLREKEVLLKEIHHRVKNNLQVVSSILNIQSRYIDDPIALEKFNECKVRIKSMALVHEKIYESNNLNEINFKEYIDSMITTYKDLFDSKEQSISVDYRSDEINKQVDIDTAMPLSLIVNELLANSYKYAFEGSGDNKISISFNGQGHETSPYVLVISDNGKGAKGRFKPENPDSMGEILIGALIEQLNARIDISDEQGTSVQIEFCRK